MNRALSRFLLLIALFSAAALGRADETAIGIGDTLSISVWGQEQLSGAVVVAPDGTISMPPPVGVLRVAGLTRADIERLLVERLNQYFKSPQVTVALKAQEGFKAFVLGEVRTPGSVIVPEKTTLQEVLTRAGGATNRADLSRIRLLRKNGQNALREEAITFTKFVSDGDPIANPTLKADDIVIVPRLPLSEWERNKVTILGAVNDPGTFDLEDSMPLLKVLTLARGTRSDAELAGVAIRSGETEKPSIVDLEAHLRGDNPRGNPDVKPGSTVFVPSIRRLEEEEIFINVLGEVQKPGLQPLRPGAKLMDALSSAGGFKEGVGLDVITVFQRESGNGEPRKVNIRDFLERGDPSANPSIQDGDTVLVTATASGVRPASTVQIMMTPHRRLNVIGEVKSPGSFLVAPDAGLMEALVLAGGPLSTADMEKAVIIHGLEGKRSRIQVNLEDILKKGKLDRLPAMNEDDTLFIPREHRTTFWSDMVRTTANVATVAATVYFVYNTTK